MSSAPTPQERDTVLRFMRLFRGSPRCHGRLEPDSGIGRASTVDSEAGEAEFLAHLRGKIGLGIVPATADGLVYFGAIDVDNHDGTIVTDHLGICEEVAKLGIPGIVTQTRRKGAHIYFFFPQGAPGIDVVPWLESIAPNFKRFGDPIEVFPKQKILVGSNKGNWINLPYFDARRGHRFALMEGQRLTLEDFIEWAETHPATVPRREIPKPKSKLEDLEHDDAPPCVQRILAEGVGEGSRDNAMFALGTYLRIREYAGDLREALDEWNRKLMRPRLSESRVSDAARRLAGGDYNYRCSDRPLCDLCDRPACQKRLFGIKAKLVEEPRSAGIDFHGLTKILTDPPTYKLELGPSDGHGTTYSISLDSSDLFNFGAVRLRVFDAAGVMVPKMKDSSWQKILKELNDSRREIQAPNDASPSAPVEAALVEFCRTAERPLPDGRPKFGVPKDLLLGRPVVLPDFDTAEPRVFFRGQDFELFLRRKKINNFKSRDIWMIVADRGCTYDELKVGDTPIIAWSKPYEPFVVSFDAPQLDERF